jgi:hypothetical protein
MYHTLYSATSEDNFLIVQLHHFVNLQNLSQRYSNPHKPTYAEVSAARSKNIIFNQVGLLSQTSDDVPSQKTKKVSREEEKEEV